MKKIISLALAVLMLATVLIACKNNSTPVGPKNTEGTETSAVENPKRRFYKDLNFGGTTITVAHRGEAYDDWIIGDDEKEGTFVAVAECNANVDGALNVVTEFVPGSSSASEFIRNEAMLVESGTDAHDVIVPDQYYGTAFAANSTYANLLDEEHSGYFQFGEEWWYNDYMSNLTMGDDIQYFAAGDISPTILGWCSCTFVNWKLYNDYYRDPNEFLKLVDRGEWTVDVLMSKCKDMYIDLDQNKRVTTGDQFGFATSKGQSAVFAAIAAGMTFSRRTSEGSFELTIAESKNNDIFEKIYDLYNNTKGAWTYDYSKYPTANSDIFGSGRSLFMNEYLMYAWRESVRSLEDGYVIVPRPKYDENQKTYLSAMQDSFYIYTIPVTTPLDKIDAVTAMIETKCIMFNEKVIPAMYDNALKIKFKSDDVDDEIASKMLDLVRDGITSDFAVVYTSSLGQMPDMVGSLIQNKSKTWASSVKAGLDRYQGYLDDLLFHFGF